MSRQPTCGPADARNRAKVARMYRDVAELAADEPGDEARNVAAGNAVLAGHRASDAICVCDWASDIVHRSTTEQWRCYARSAPTD